MLFTPSGIVRAVIPAFEKAYVPIDVTVPGIVILFKAAQL